MSQVEVDEVLGLVRDIATEIPSDDAMPGRIVLLVKLLLNVGRDVLLNVELLQGLSGAVHRILLHLLRHVCILDHCLAVGHLFTKQMRPQSPTNLQLTWLMDAFLVEILHEFQRGRLGFLAMYWNNE